MARRKIHIDDEKDLVEMKIIEHSKKPETKEGVDFGVLNMSLVGNRFYSE